MNILTVKTWRLHLMLIVGVGGGFALYFVLMNMLRSVDYCLINLGNGNGFFCF